MGSGDLTETATVTSCSHGMPTPAACVECMEDGNIPPRPRVREVADSPVIPARHAAGCDVCGERIEQGDDIVHTNLDRWVHSTCVP